MNAGKISAIMTLLLSFFILPGSILAYSGGSGDPNNPYQIASAADLLALATDTNNYDKSFLLTADINLAPYTFTTAIIAPDTINPDTVFNGTAFTGVFDGNGHTISNLTIYTGNDFLGLFGEIGSGGEVKNLGLENVSITSGDSSIDLGPVGIIVITVSFPENVGGLVGDNNNGIISNCYSSGTVVADGYLGGLVGVNNGGTISDCYSTGNVNGGEDLGGLVGVSNGGTISDCYSAGAVNGGYFFGGLVGVNDSGTISNCYSTGDVNGGEDPGGLVGYNYGTISNCYSTGDVNGEFNLGGLVAVNAGTITACFWDTNTSGQSTSSGGTGKTTSEMKTESTFTNSGWDFVNVWRIREGVSYPILHMSIYSGGLGTASDPYKIATADDLLAMAVNTDDYDKHFILTADINLASYTFTTAVIAPDTNNSNYTFDEIAFTGIFDGNNHTISNLIVDTNGAGNDFLGLFGEIGSGGKVKNLALKNVSITGGDTSVALGELAGENYYGTISDCHSGGTISGGSPSWCVGGLTGWNSGSISNCYSTSSVSSGDGSYYLGGLAGYNYHGTISDCHSSGTITSGSSSWSLGGLVGAGDGGNISNCYSTIAVSGGDNSEKLGGLMGENSDGGIIGNCFSSGKTSSGADSEKLGGLAGFNDNSWIYNCYSTGDAISGGGDSEDIGGLVGCINSGDVNNCYSTGNVSGINSYLLGGLAGYNDGGTINQCYFLITSGPADGNGSPLTDKQMKLQKSFAGWDFNDIWWINEKVSYPKLFWQLNVTNCTVTAGSKPNTDKISILGTMNASADDINDANVIEVTINSADIVNPAVLKFPIDVNTFKKGKYSYSKTVNGIKKSLTYDVKTHKFTFSASNLDLSGLSCPLTVQIEIGDYSGIAVVDEAIVNGPTKPIPIQLMTAVKNVLRVDKCQVKHGSKKLSTDQLLVSGVFTVENPDVNMPNRVSESLVITLGTQHFTISKSELKAGKGKFTCSKANVTENGTATADFNFNTCSFTLTIKNTVTITATGTVDFGIAFAGFNEVVQITPQ